MHFKVGGVSPCFIASRGQSPPFHRKFCDSRDVPLKPFIPDEKASFHIKPMILTLTSVDFVTLLEALVPKLCSTAHVDRVIGLPNHFPYERSVHSITLPMCS